MFVFFESEFFKRNKSVDSCELSLMFLFVVSHLAFPDVLLGIVHEAHDGVVLLAVDHPFLTLEEVLDIETDKEVSVIFNLAFVTHDEDTEHFSLDGAFELDFNLLRVAEINGVL